MLVICLGTCDRDLHNKIGTCYRDLHNNIGTCHRKGMFWFLKFNHEINFESNFTIMIPLYQVDCNNSTSFGPTSRQKANEITGNNIYGLGGTYYGVSSEGTCKIGKRHRFCTIFSERVFKWLNELKTSIAPINALMHHVFIDVCFSYLVGCVCHPIPHLDNFTRNSLHILYRIQGRGNIDGPYKNKSRYSGCNNIFICEHEKIIIGEHFLVVMNRFL